jgi:hypothetical protein
LTAFSFAVNLYIFLSYFKYFHLPLAEGPGSRRDCALGYHDAENRLFLFGGRSKGKIHNDTWYYDFDDKNWIMVNPTTAPEARFTMAFGVWSNKMFISTGEGPKKVFYNDVWR